MMQVKICFFFASLAILTEAQIVRLPLTRHDIQVDYTEKKFMQVSPSPYSSKDKITNDVNLIIPISIGKIPFKLTLDTTSKGIWVPSTSCTTAFCNGKSQYDGTPIDSNEAQTENGMVRGHFYNATVEIDEDTYGPTTFVGADYVSPSLLNTIVSDGSVGLADKQVIQGIQNVQNIISIYISGDKSAVYFGGAPSDLTVSSVENAPKFLMNNIVDQWKLSIDYIKADYAPWNSWCPYGCFAILDSTYSGISGPMKAVSKLNAYLGADDDGNIDCYKVETVSPLIFHIQGGRYKLDPKNFIVKNDDPYNHKCKTVFEGKYDSDWRLGISFMQQFLTVFDYDRMSVAFLDLIENISKSNKKCDA